MSSNRPYRSRLSLAQIDKIFREGAERSVGPESGRRPLRLPERHGGNPPERTGREPDRSGQCDIGAELIRCGGISCTSDWIAGPRRDGRVALERAAQSRSHGSDEVPSMKSPFLERIPTWKHSAAGEIFIRRDHVLPRCSEANRLPEDYVAQMDEEVRGCVRQEGHDRPMRP